VGAKSVRSKEQLIVIIIYLLKSTEQENAHMKGTENWRLHFAHKKQKHSEDTSHVSERRIHAGCRRK